MERSAIRDRLTIGSADPGLREACHHCAGAIALVAERAHSRDPLLQPGYDWLLAFLQRNAERSTALFGVPTKQVLEFGSRSRFGCVDKPAKMKWPWPKTMSF